MESQASKLGAVVGNDFSGHPNSVNDILPKESYGFSIPYSSKGLCLYSFPEIVGGKNGIFLLSRGFGSFPTKFIPHLIKGDEGMVA